MLIDYFIITIYCCVVDLLKKILLGLNLRSRGFAPKLTDAEVITMEIVGEFLGIDSDKHIWNYFRTYWNEWFPNLGSRSNFVRQASNLWHIKQLIQQELAMEMGAYQDNIHMVDGHPIPICHFRRAKKCKTFKGQANYGYCAAKDETYYGFHGHISINFNGVISGYTITAANGDEREALWEISEGTKGLWIGDMGYISETLQSELRSERSIDLQTPLRSNMHDNRPKRFVKQITAVRRKIETVIGQLTDHFNIEKVRARDLWHLTNRATRKILAHTIGVFVNQMLGREPLQFEGLIRV